jgi:membrane protein implicated in regulation of membrane protease activity
MNNIVIGIAVVYLVYRFVLKDKIDALIERVKTQAKTRAEVKAETKAVASAVHVDDLATSWDALRQKCVAANLKVAVAKLDGLWVDLNPNTASAPPELPTPISRS